MTNIASVNPANGATFSSTYGLQSMVEQVFMNVANNLLYNQMTKMQSALGTTESAINLLANVQDLHNDVAVVTKPAFSFDYSTSHATSGYLAAYRKTASAYYNSPVGIQPTAATAGTTPFAFLSTILAQRSGFLSVFNSQNTFGGGVPYDYSIFYTNYIVPYFNESQALGAGFGGQAKQNLIQQLFPTASQQQQQALIGQLSTLNTNYQNALEFGSPNGYAEDNPTTVTAQVNQLLSTMGWDKQNALFSVSYNSQFYNSTNFQEKNLATEYLAGRPVYNQILTIMSYPNFNTTPSALLLDVTLKANLNPTEVRLMFSATQGSEITSGFNSIVTQFLAAKSALSTSILPALFQQTPASARGPNSLYGAMQKVLADMNTNNPLTKPGVLTFHPATVTVNSNTYYSGYYTYSGAIVDWLTDGYNKSAGAGGTSAGNINTNIATAITAAQSLNTNNTSKVSQALLLYQEYYQCAAALLSKMTQVMQQIAQNITSH